MKKSTQLITILTSTAIAGLLTFANVAHAGPGSDKGEHKHGQMTKAEKEAKMKKRFNRIAEKLSLSDSQKTQVQSVMKSNRSETKSIRKEMRSLRKEMKTLDQQSDDYVVKINRQAELKSQMEVYKTSINEQLSSILSAEQLAQWEEMKSKKKGRKGKRGMKHKDQTVS